MDSTSSESFALSNVPGAYALAVRVDNPRPSAGETINVEVFITGYGNVGGAKIIFYP